MRISIILPGVYARVCSYSLPFHVLDIPLSILLVLRVIVGCIVFVAWSLVCWRLADVVSKLPGYVSY